MFEDVIFLYIILADIRVISSGRFQFKIHQEAFSKLKCVVTAAWDLLHLVEAQW